MSSKDVITAAIIEDNQGVEWQLKLSLRALTRICKYLRVTLAQLTVFEVPIGDLLECIHMMCVKQIESEGVTVEDFYNRLDNVPMPVVTEAIKIAVIEAFPQAAEQLGGTNKGKEKAPFAGGGEKTSSS